jgi:hypothetical protein
MIRAHSKSMSDLPNMSKDGHLLEDIKSSMLFLRMVSLVHVKHEANSAAYILVRELSPIL